MKKKESVDKNGNKFVKVWFKEGNSTMLFCKATENGAKALINGLNTFARNLGVTLNGKFIYTK